MCTPVLLRFHFKVAESNNTLVS